MNTLFADRVRCLLVQPRFSRNNFLNFQETFRFIGARYTSPPLGLLTVAALLPQHWEFIVIDENVRPLTNEHLEWADIVLTGGMLPQQVEILDIIVRAHDNSKPVVIGGVDPTSQPKVYQQADFLVLGEGEMSVPRFLEDLSKGASSGFYPPDGRADMTDAVVPRFDLIRFADYLRVDVQFSRGCPYHCEFCEVVELFGRRPRPKSPGQVLAELQTLYDLGYRGHINLLDDNFLGSKARGLELLEAMRDWSARHNFPFFFSTDASINLVKEERLMRLMQENDFRYVFVGIESPDASVLLQTQKRHNVGISVVDAVRTLGTHGMSVVGGFILGFDSETQETARHMSDLIQDAGICMAYAGMLSALPNTQLWHRLRREGRLFSGDLMLMEGVDGDYTIYGLNFATLRPRTDILRDYAGVLREIYHPENYYARILHTATNLVPSHKYRPGLGASVKRFRGFLRISARAGLSRQTGLLYWKTLLKVFFRNPRGLEFAVNMAALYVHFSKQLERILPVLEKKRRYVKGIGEEQYNQSMTARHTRSA